MKYNEYSDSNPFSDAFVDTKLRGIEVTCIPVVTGNDLA